MSRFLTLVWLLPLFALAACSSAEDRAAAAEEDVAKRRLELIEKHQECVNEADGDQEKLDACEYYLKEADALK